MDILTALVLLLILVVVIDTALTIGIIRRLRVGGVAEQVTPHEILPVGYQVDPTRDEAPWPPDLDQILTGDWLAVLALRGCNSCETVRRELAARAPHNVRVCVMVDPTSGTPAELAEFLSRWKVDVRIVAPAAYELMFSIGSGAPSYPAILHLRDGRVLDSGRRVRQILGLTGAHHATSG